MFSSMAIQNYRVFKDFKLDDIARANLIVGTNNSGKSSLLEAIYLLTSEDPASSLLYILSERGEYANRAIDPRYDRRLLGGYLISHIFNGRSADKDHGVLIQSNNTGSSSLSISVSDLRIRENETSQFSLFDDEDIDTVTRSKLLIIEHRKQGEETHRETLRINENLISNRNYPRKINTPQQNARLVTTNYLSYEDLAILWDTITLTPREDQVVEALQIVDDKVDRLSFTSRQNSSSGVLLKLRGEKEPIPLSSMGDGMRRVLAIIASLVSVDNGTLLVDEIDTGLHYAVLKDMWKIIFETAVRVDAQVFATTHSWDCVRAFQQAIRESMDHNIGRLIRLDRIGGQIEAVGYSANELNIAIKQGIEVR